MRKTFEHLLGLNATDALAILRSSGIFDVRVTFTQAPPRPSAKVREACAPDDEPQSMLQSVAEQFQVSDDSEPPLDPLLEPVVEEGVLKEARVIGVRDDGRQLIVSRFRVSPQSPKPDEA